MQARLWVWVLAGLAVVVLILILLMQNCGGPEDGNGNDLISLPEECCFDADGNAMVLAPDLPDAAPMTPLFPVTNTDLLELLSGASTPLPTLPAEDEFDVFQVTLLFEETAGQWGVSVGDMVGVPGARLSPLDVHEELFAKVRPGRRDPDYLVVVSDAAGRPLWWTGLSDPTTVRREIPGPPGSEMKMIQRTGVPAAIGLRLRFVPDGTLTIYDTTRGYDRPGPVVSVTLGSSAPGPPPVGRG